jgi:hypothetical protein
VAARRRPREVDHAACPSSEKRAGRHRGDAGLLVVAIGGDHRRLPIVAASLTSVSIGPWGIGCVLWGTVIALAFREPIE